MLLPFKNLLGARAAARHISEGGHLHDDIGAHITNTVGQMGQLKNFINYSKRNKLVNEDTVDIIESVRDAYSNIRQDLTRMISCRGYNNFVEGFEPVELILSEDDLDEMKDRFTVKKHDDNVFESLPLINSIYKTAMENKVSTLDQIREFIENGDLMLEGSLDSDMLARSVQHSDVRGLVQAALEDISTRIVDNNIIKEFAQTHLNQELTESEESALAVQLAKKYVSDLGRIAEDAEYAERVRHIRLEDNTQVDESQLVDEWANNIVNNLEEKLTTVE
jgi:hypothetical protein